MNIVVGLSFKVVFSEKSTCGSHEQCTEPIVLITNAEANQNLVVSKLSHLVTVWKAFPSPPLRLAFKR